MKSPHILLMTALMALVQTTSWAKVQPILPAESAGAVLRRIGCTVDTILDKSCSILDISQATQDIATTILDNSYSILDISQTTKEIATTILDTSYSILDKSCSTLDILIALEQCSSSAITAPTTITAAGVYCLANAINGTIAVNASDVFLNLNNHAITNTGAPGITIGIGYESITICNGTLLVTGADAITASGTTDLVLSRLLISNAARGFYGTQINRGHIAQCDFMSNSTGLELDESVNLLIDQCTAANNSSAGFSFINSTNNCVQNSKSLNNGSTASGDAFGFVSANGSGNMFTGCVADGTQTATTNFCTVAAGFALLGTEQCSKIADCSACNASGPFETALVGTQTAVYSALPCGIYLQAQTANPVLTEQNVGNTNIGTINSVDWSPDAKYLAVGANNITGNDIRVYQFDPAATPALAELNVGNTNIGTINSINWSPDGKYLAVGGNIAFFGNDIRVYQFDPAATPVLAELNVGNTDLGTIRSVNWSSDGNYLAICGQITSMTLGNNDIRVYQFDPAATPVLAELNVGSLDSGDIRSVNWSPDGNYLAIGGTISGNDIRVYQFDPAATPVLTLLFGGSLQLGTINSVNWSPDGNYLAIGGTISGNDIRVYQFDPAATPVLAELNVGSLDIGTINSVNWSGDGKYLAIGANNISGNDIRVYQFDPAASPVLSELNAGSTNVGTINSVNWSPDGNYLAAGGNITSSSNLNDIRVYSILQFPIKNFIQNNTASCNMTTSTTSPRGTGISGSSRSNCIIGNTSYNNPFNYTFVTNVHSQLLNGNTNPSRLQNVSLIGCQPICMPNELDCVAITTATINTRTNCIDSMLRQLLAAQSIIADC